MGSPTKRRVSLYCTVISQGPLLIVRMPEGFVRWDVIRTAINAMMRRDYGVLAKNIHLIEGFAGGAYDDPDTDGGQALDLCTRAFGGDIMTLPRFELQAWDDASRTFELVRSGAPAEEGARIPKYPLARRDRDGWYSDGDYEARGGRLEWMSPQEYISRVRPLVIDECSRENIDDLKDHVAAGRPLDPLKIYADGREDGRHRAHAAMELGLRSVPVVTWDRTTA